VVSVLLQIPAVLGFALSGLALVLKVFALVDAAVRPPAAFTATSNQTKVFWVGILTAGLVLSVLFLFSPTIIFNLVAVCAASVYLAGVRPAIKEALGRTGR
jgi:hypothetical protein